MVFNLRDLSSRLEDMNQDGSLEWSSASDLARMSMDAMAARSGPDRARSRGTLRLFGSGIEGHSGSMEAVGKAMSRWQRLIIALVGSAEGHTSVRGRLPASVVDAARLDLVSSPSPGSLTLTFEPHVAPHEEIERVLDAFDQPDTQKVDDAVIQAMELISAGASAGPDDPSNADWVELLKAHGPRAASALCEWTGLASASGFDIDVRWERPNVRTQRARMTASQATYITQIIESEDLQREESVLRGELVTISDRAPLQLRLPDGDIVSIKSTKISHDHLQAVKHLDMVEVKVEVSVAHGVGDQPRVTYTALGLRRL